MTVPMIKSIGDVPYPIDTHSDAFSPLLTAGAALGITGEATDSAAWLQRVSTSDGPTTIRSIHGRTLVWNQLVQNGNFANGSYHWAARESTLTVADGVATVTPTSDGMARGLQASSTMGTAVVGHKYLISTEFNTNEATNINISFSGASPVTVVVPSTGAWHKCGAIWANSNETRILPYLLTTASVTTSAQLKYRNVQIFDLTAMFGAGSEPSTVAEFEALYPADYYPYDAGSLLPVNMEGIETVGFNQWDEEVEAGGINTGTGQNTTTAGYNRSKNYIPVFPSTEYYIKTPVEMALLFYDVDKTFITDSVLYRKNNTFTTPANARYMRFRNNAANAWPTYNHDICINISDPTRNGEYAPYWHQQRTIPAGTLRSAGSVYDEQTETERIVRVGEVDLGTLDWTKGSTTTDGTASEFYTANANLGSFDDAPMDGPYTLVPYSDWGTLTLGQYMASGQRVIIAGDPSLSAAEFKTSLSGVTMHYALATPTTTPNDPALNLTYRTEQDSTERIIVPTGENSAPPTIVAAQGYTAESLRDAALATIAPVENGTASTNYGVGSYLVHGGQLCKVTTAIATGESITIGTNVVTTTVMAEVIALIAQ